MPVMASECVISVFYWRMRATLLVRVTVRRARKPLRFVLRCRPHPLSSLTLPCFSAMLWVWL